MKVKAEVESKAKVSVDKFHKAKVNRGVEQRGKDCGRGKGGGCGTCACAWHVDFVRAALRQLDRTVKGRGAEGKRGQEEEEGGRGKK